MEETIRKKTILLIKENMEDKKDEILEQDELISDLNFDSVLFMGLLYSLEEEFELEIINDSKNYKFFSVITVKDLLNLLIESLEERENV